MTAREGNMGNCHPEKTNVDPATFNFVLTGSNAAETLKLHLNTIVNFPKTMWRNALHEWVIFDPESLNTIFNWLLLDLCETNMHTWLICHILRWCKHRVDLTFWSSRVVVLVGYLYTQEASRYRLPLNQYVWNHASVGSWVPRGVRCILGTKGVAERAGGLA